MLRLLFCFSGEDLRSLFSGCGPDGSDEADLEDSRSEIGSALPKLDGISQTDAYRSVSCLSGGNLVPEAAACVSGDFPGMAGAERTADGVLAVHVFLRGGVRLRG